jgi:hypothetical protein
MLKGFIFIFVLISLSGCSFIKSQPITDQECTVDWYEKVESQIMTDDGQGHGPDPGTDEWKNVVEFRLEIRDDPSVPNTGSEEWCSYIDNYLVN